MTRGKVCLISDGHFLYLISVGESREPSIGSAKQAAEEECRKAPALIDKMVNKSLSFSGAVRSFADVENE